VASLVACGMERSIPIASVCETRNEACSTQYQNQTNEPVSDGTTMMKREGLRGIY
jgi:hypothetical protein